MLVDQHVTAPDPVYAPAWGPNLAPKAIGRIELCKVWFRRCRLKNRTTRFPKPLISDSQLSVWHPKALLVDLGRLMVRLRGLRRPMLPPRQMRS